MTYLPLAVLAGGLAAVSRSTVSIVTAVLAAAGALAVAVGLPDWYAVPGFFATMVLAGRTAVSNWKRGKGLPAKERLYGLLGLAPTDLRRDALTSHE